MSWYNKSDYFKPSKPIKTDQGIKARSKRGDFVKNWWATRWIEALEDLIDAGRLRRGRRYARQGQVLSIEETEKGIEAEVQGSKRKPYKVTISVSELSDQQWDEVLEALAGQALFTAQLLAGEMPQNIEEAFEAAGATLFPANPQELDTRCTCPDPAIPCKHVAAVHHLLGEQFDEDPFLLFRLRGRSQAEIMEMLKARRVDQTGPDTEIEAGEEAPLLSDSLGSFWDMGQPLTGFKTTIKPPATEFPVLRRLGQPSFLKEDVLELLGPAYQAICDMALVIAFEEDEENSS